MNTPVLFIVFNRPHTTKKVFEAIRQAKPKQLFVAADGPRSDKEGEYERCTEVRKLATSVDWDCEVKTLFRTENIGCGRGPSEAITWFFEHVESGIILEDDCLPEPSFFPFCNELLQKYEHNGKIVIISGFNPLGTFDVGGSHYFFTQHGGIWGWATWRRAWKHFNYNVPEWKNEGLRAKVLKAMPSESDIQDMNSHLNTLVQGEDVHYWDFQWWFYRLLQNGIGIMPKFNLIQNIGFGADATHTFDKKSYHAGLKTKPLHFPIKHPDTTEPNIAFAQQIFQNQNAKNRDPFFKIKRFIKNFSGIKKAKA